MTDQHCLVFHMKYWAFGHCSSNVHVPYEILGIQVFRQCSGNVGAVSFRKFHKKDTALTLILIPYKVLGIQALFPIIYKGE